MSTSHEPPSASRSSPPDPALVTAMTSRLRAEYDRSDSPTNKAILLHELGVLEELTGDEAAAARDHLAAVNAEPEFREPLERLVVLIERRQSYKNLGKLLERLVRIAVGRAERARSLADYGIFKAEHEQDLDGGKALLEEAVAEQPDDASLWLALERVAGQLGDAPLRARALAARAELTQHAEWRNLLLVDLGRVLATTEDLDAATSALERAATSATTATFPAVVALERLAAREGRDEPLAAALETQAAHLLQAIEDGATGDALGVPPHLRAPSYAADALLRAAYARRRLGAVAAASELVDRALALLPTEPALLHARMAVADALGDMATVTVLARKRLEVVVNGPVAAGLWLRLAEGAAAESDVPAALAAVNQALACDPGSIPALVLKLDLLTGAGEGAALAATLETVAERLETEDARARLFLLAAYVWASAAGEVDGAKAALSQAGMYGSAPATVARVARTLATLVGDAHWFEESTRRLLTTGAPDTETTSLWLELAEARRERGDHEGVAKALEALAATPNGKWLGSALTSFLLPFLGDVAPERSNAALAALADAEPDPEASRALRQVLARRARAAGRQPESLDQLAALHDDAPRDLVLAEQLAVEYRRAEQPLSAADVLSSVAHTVVDEALSAALQLEAGLLRFRAGARPPGLESFEAAASAAPEASAPLLAWALRAAEPDDPDARRRALEGTSEDPEPALTALERFTLELVSGAEPTVAAAALSAIDAAAPSDLSAAADLARALHRAEEPGAVVTALETLGERSAGAAAMARAAHHQLLVEVGATAEEQLSAAIAWAEIDRSPTPALEWLAAAAALGEPQQERAAREALAERLGELAAPDIHASARLIGMLTGDDTQPLLPPTTPASRLTNLELAPPAGDPRRRATAMAELDDTLGDEAAAMGQALAGYNHLAAGDLAAAERCFRTVVEAFPTEVTGWEGLRAWGEMAADRSVVAEATAALGDIVKDSARGAELWEQAGLILLDELRDAERAELAFGRAVERDIRRGVAFDKLFRMVRARKDGPRLLELIAQRLEVADDPAELGKLFWERARVLRNQNRIDDALAALENVTLLEPDHVGALALAGEIYIRRGSFPEAAESLARLANLQEAPAQQRLMSGIAAVDLFENKLGQLDRGLEVLLGLYRAGLSTLPVRERLARTAAKLGDWRAATDALEELMVQRETAAARIEAARLAMAIHRDRLDDLTGAEAAACQLLGEAPADGEALDVVLAGAFPDELSRELLVAGRDAIVEQLQAEPMQPELIDRLARIAATLSDAPLRQAALGALVAVGEGTPEIDHELEILDQRVARLPQIAIDERALPELCDPDDYGPVGELIALAAPTIAEALGPGLAALGVGRKQRVDPRSGLPLRNEVAAWAGALGVGDFDLFVGGTDEHGVCGVAAERPAIVLGARVTAPLSPTHRQQLARELFALRRGATILRHRDASDVAAIVVAIARLVGVEIPSQRYALLGEFERQLGRSLPRKLRKPLADQAERVRQEGQDPHGWVAAATSSLDRMAAIAAGDVSHVLAADPSGRGRLGASLEAQQRAARLLVFVLSPSYLTLREQLGMGVR